MDGESHALAYLLPPPINLCRPRYSTGSNLNTYSALIQNFYSQETAPHQAIHVAVNTGVEIGEQAGVKAYVGFVIDISHCFKLH